MVDVGHCPGEGCIYGTWTAHENIPVYEHPFDTCRIDLIPSGDTFTAVTGNVYFVPQIVVLDETNYEHCAYNENGYLHSHPGDTLYILTNIGEGHYKVRIRDDDGISDRWENNNYEAWWVKVSTKNNVAGWIVYKPGLRVSGSDAFE